MSHNGVAIIFMVMGGKPTSARVTAYLPQEVAKVLEQWAKSENRTVSNLAATILLNAVESRQPKQQYKKEEDVS